MYNFRADVYLLFIGAIPTKNAKLAGNKQRYFTNTAIFPH